MKKAVIYGCGKIGKFAYEIYKHQYEILFFVDKDADKIKEYGGGVKVYKPQALIDYANITIIIASIYYKEMLDNLNDMGIAACDIAVFRMWLEEVLPSGEALPALPGNIESVLDKRTINLGAWLNDNKKLALRELTFIPGGSMVLDYMFLRHVALTIGCREYLEVGTYIGESINILTDCCERLYSVTLPGESVKDYFLRSKRPYYMGRLANDEKIVHYYTDSKVFNFSKHAGTVDLYFIDGDHSYDGVYHDTKNIFANRKDDSVVVWHDCKIGEDEYRAEVIKAIYDVLGKDFDNFYVTDNNMCGIYIPKSRFDELGFVMHERRYEENAPLYTYDISLSSKVQLAE